MPDSTSTSATPSLWYRALRALTASALRVFYRRIEVTGVQHLDLSAPTILASNHPNSIMDPLTVGLFESRRVAFCARDGLFRVPVFGQLLRSVGAIPIQRRSDHGAAADNAAAFGACRAVLADRGCISLFPEGHTHAALKVGPLRTGVARIALDAERAHGYDLGVVVVPVGLNFLVRQAFRSDVHVAFGPPLRAAAYAELDRRDPREAARRMTEDLSAAMRALTVHVEQEDDERLIAQTTAIVAGIRTERGLDEGGQSPAERTALAQRIVHAYHWYADVNPERFAALRRRMTWFVEERRRLGLGGEAPVLQHRSETLGWGDLSGAQRWMLAVFGAPVALLGLAASLAPYLALRAVLAVARPDLVRLAWFKFLVGTAAFGAWWVTLGVIVGRQWGTAPALALAALLLPLTLFSLRYVTELGLYRASPWTLLRGLRHGDRLHHLRVQRDRLHQDLTEVRDHYLAVHPTSASEG